MVFCGKLGLRGKNAGKSWHSRLTENHKPFDCRMREDNFQLEYRNCLPRNIEACAIGLNRYLLFHLEQMAEQALLD